MQRVARILRTSSLSFSDLYFSKITLCSPELLRGILRPEFFRSLDWSTSARPAYLSPVFAGSWPELVKMSYADLRFRLVEDMLVKVDRMSMAHSLEVRSPFLDHHVVEFVFNLQPSLKLRGSTSKAILRDAMRARLPAETLRKGKQGFKVPLRAWLRGELYEMARDYLTGDGGLPEDVFDRGGVAALLSAHVDGRADHSAVIWALLSYAAWEEAYLRPTSATGVAAAV
jgi:asparagine synthase (glutamine-hydrolysing)